MPFITFHGFSADDEKKLEFCRKHSAPIVIITVILSISTIVAIVLLTRDNSPKACYTSGCNLSAHYILSFLNEKQDPCKDFYSFACGNYIGNSKNAMQDKINEILFKLIDYIDKPDSHLEPRSIHKFRRAYKVCMTEIPIEEAKTFFNIFVKKCGGWPMAGKELEPPGRRIDIEELTAKLERMGFPSNIFTVTIIPDSKNTSVAKLEIDQPDFKFLYNDINDVQMAAIMDFLILGILVDIFENKNLAVLRKDYEAVKNFSKELKEILTPPIQRDNFMRMNNRMTIRQLQDLTGNVFDFHKFFTSMFNGYIEIQNDEEIIVAEVDFMKRWANLLVKYDSIVIANYAVWNAMEVLSLEIPPDSYLSKKNEFLAVKADYLCLLSVGNMLPFTLWRIIVDNFVDSNSIKSAKSIVKTIVNEYKSTIETSKWLDETSKQTAKDKVDAILWKLGYPEFIYDYPTMNNLYNDKRLTDSHMTNVLFHHERSRRENLQSLRLPIRKDLLYSEELVTALYNYQTNSVFFTPTIFQPPIYSGDRLQSLNYGSFGALTGHEISHAFLRGGFQFDKNGILKPWLSDQAQNIYVNQQRCFVKQYNTYCPKDSYTCVDGELTVGENVNDNIGLEISYRAYQQWVKENDEEGKLPGLEKFSHNQLFFISHAVTWCGLNPDMYSVNEVHSPSKFRVQGPLSNFKEFSKVFNCQPGPMNRDSEKCSFW